MVALQRPTHAHEKRPLMNEWPILKSTITLKNGNTHMVQPQTLTRDIDMNWGKLIFFSLKLFANVILNFRNIEYGGNFNRKQTFKVHSNTVKILGRGGGGGGLIG